MVALVNFMDGMSKPISREERAKLAAWLLTQRGRRQYRHAPKAARSVQNVMKPLSRKYGAGVSAIAQNWQDIAGSRFSKVSRPVKITGGREGRTLHIQASGAAAALITAASGQILGRLNTFLGYGHIARLKVTQSKIKRPATAKTDKRAAPRGLLPSEEKELRLSLSTVEDPALKQALEKLGRKALTHSSPSQTAAAQPAGRQDNKR